MNAASLRSAPTSLPEYLPASQYLQNRLQERRARSIRPRHARQSDFGPSIRARDDDIFFDEAESARINARRFDSSPLAAMGRAESDAGVVGSSKRRAPGVRDVDEKLDRLNKENFALKLELDHRRDHTVKLQQQITDMQAKVDRAETLEAEHAELLRINSELVEELEKRDKAVEEAMDIICDLEDRVAEMEERSSQTRPSTAQADSGYAGTETQETVPRSSPPQVKTPRKDRPPPTTASAMANKLFQAVNLETPAKIRREPSVLSQQKPSTHALRSVYLEAAGNLHSVKSFNSLLSRRDNTGEDGAPELESPRLSVLSESSFPSLYSPNKERPSPGKHTWEKEEFQEDSIKRINRWIDEGSGVDDTPSKSRRLSVQVSDSTVRPNSPPPTDQERTLDVAAALNIHADQRTRQVLQAREPSYDRQPYPSRTGMPRSSKLRPNSIAGPIFSESAQPPTAESPSIRLLRTSRSSKGEERSILDLTPAPIKGYNAMEASVRTAPRQMRSSVELKTAHQSNQSIRDSAIDDDDESRSETMKDFAREYAGYPDGKSILMGTPSRFIKHGAPPASNLMFDGSDASPSRGAASSARRRKSSSEAALSPWRPSLGRAETSPPLPAKVVTNFSRLTIDPTTMSPNSSQSNSSGNRTVIQTTQEDSVEPVSGQTSISFVSPSRSLSHKTQRLFRRLSGGPQDQPLPTLDARSYREKPPLPKLTSTPSSAYTMIPREIRRPSTAGTEKQAQTNFSPIARPASSARDRHASRSRSRAGEPRSSSVAAVERVPDDRERKSLFKRSQSVKQAPPVVDTPPPVPVAASPTPAPVEESKGLFSRRKNSIKDAVIGLPRKPWRTSGNINATNL